MVKNILIFTFIVLGMIVILNFSDHNLKKSISACIVAQLQTAESPDAEKAKKVCEERLKKDK